MLPVHLLRERLDAVLAVVYLIFNEGYGGRDELAAEACSAPPSSPNGRSSVWLSPAEYPSAEIVMSQITLPIRLALLSSPRGDLRRLRGELPVKHQHET
jgi:hypothetical protein